MLFESFIGSSYESISPLADVEELINMYRVKIGTPGATSKYALYPTPGVEELAEAASGPGRAHFYKNGREFAVIGSTLWEIDMSGSVMTNRGTVAVDGNPATITSNGDGGDQLFVTSGSNGYVYDLAGNTLTQIAALNGKATMGDHLDGYFLALDATTSTVYFSALLNGASWTTGTDNFQRSAMPDRWKAMKVLPSRNILLLGEETSEVWYDAGNATSPFLLHPSGVIPYGIAAPFSVAIAGKDAVWLGTSRTGGVQAYRMAGFTPEVISTEAFSHAVEKYVLTSDAHGDAYQEDGHVFYTVSFPRQDITWGWDADTREWHKRGTWIPAQNKYTAWRPRWHANAFGEHRMLDASTGSVYRMANNIYTDVDGTGIRRLRRAPALINQNKWVTYGAFELGVEVGVGLTTGQGSDPQIMMRMSNDAGKTWGNEMWRSLGKIGAFSDRVRWNRLGMSRKRVFEVVVSDPVPVHITEAWLEITAGGPEQDAQAQAQGGGRSAA